VNNINQIAVFDLETTGLDLANSKIVTACVAVIDSAGNLVGQAQEWLANPGIEIPSVAASVHGVTTEYAIANGRPLGEVVAEINAKLSQFFPRVFQLLLITPVMISPFCTATHWRLALRR